MSDWYILGPDCKTPIRMDFEDFLKHHSTSSRIRQDESVQPGDSWARVALTTLPDGSYVSTVFLGLDHSFGDGPPLLFESMAFEAEEKEFFIGDKMHKYHEELMQERYSTWDEAELGHKTMVVELEYRLSNK